MKKYHQEVTNSKFNDLKNVLTDPQKVKYRLKKQGAAKNDFSWIDNQKEIEAAIGKNLEDYTLSLENGSIFYLQWINKPAAISARASRLSKLTGFRPYNLLDLDVDFSEYESYTLASNLYPINTCLNLKPLKKSEYDKETLENFTNNSDDYYKDFVTSMEFTYDKNKKVNNVNSIMPLQMLGVSPYNDPKTELNDENHEELRNETRKLRSYLGHSFTTLNIMKYKRNFLETRVPLFNCEFHTLLFQYINLKNCLKNLKTNHSNKTEEIKKYESAIKFLNDNIIIKTLFTVNPLTIKDKKNTNEKKIITPSGNIKVPYHYYDLFKDKEYTVLDLNNDLITDNKNLPPKYTTMAKYAEIYKQCYSIKYVFDFETPDFKAAEKFITLANYIDESIDFTMFIYDFSSMPVVTEVLHPDKNSKKKKHSLHLLFDSITNTEVFFNKKGGEKVPVEKINKDFIKEYVNSIDLVLVRNPRNSKIYYNTSKEMIKKLQDCRELMKRKNIESSVSSNITNKSNKESRMVFRFSDNKYYTQHDDTIEFSTMFEPFIKNIIKHRDKLKVRVNDAFVFQTNYMQRKLGTKSVTKLINEIAETYDDVEEYILSPDRPPTHPSFSAYNKINFSSFSVSVDIKDIKYLNILKLYRIKPAKASITFNNVDDFFEIFDD